MVEGIIATIAVCIACAAACLGIFFYDLFIHWESGDGED
jgi:hypothetical protein